jgi:hypothetical protein
MFSIFIYSIFVAFLSAFLLGIGMFFSTRIFEFMFSGDIDFRSGLFIVLLVLTGFLMSAASYLMLR